jgi:hypothetical protein
MKRVMLAIGLALMFGGCATTYHDSGLTGGYTETRLDENIWTVRFAGNGYTSGGRATDFCMLRCAELCLENGFSHFIIVSAESNASVSTHTTPSTSYTTGNAYTSGNAYTYGNTTYGSATTTASATTTTYGGSSYTISKPRKSNTIVCFKEKPEGLGMAYNAQFLMDSIKTKYKLNK